MSILSHAYGNIGSSQLCNDLLAVILCYLPTPNGHINGDCIIPRLRNEKGYLSYI